MDTKMIGSFLKELRKENNMTQEQLGERIGVTNKTVSRWETGNYMPPVESLILLSDICYGACDGVFVQCGEYGCGWSEKREYKIITPYSRLFGLKQMPTSEVCWHL